MPSAATDPAAHNMWKQLDQLVISLLLSSLTEEALSITIGFTTSRDVWNSLETTFSQKSKARELQIKDELHLMRRGSRSILEYSRIFKAHCNQLSTMGCPIEDTDKVHWYLRGLGHEFSTFSITQLSLTLIPSFKDIVPKAESFDLFSKSIDHNTGVPAYVANFSPASSHQFGNSNNYQHKYKGGPPKGGHRSKQYIKPYANRYIKPDANFVEALAHHTINDEPADWYTDTSASAHMTADASQLDKVEPYTGKDKVIIDYIAFHDLISSPPVMASTNSSIGHSSPSSVTSSIPCKTYALDLLSPQSTSSLVPSVPTPQEAQPPALPIASVLH
uniref:Retrotransposon gag domain-containing protein n=1 Tax=Populus alba TaxID=43335 RepID=A0A4U5LSK1_POPAL|nr:hypothetical protein D5086_0000327510 [Populus alba]